MNPVIDALLAAMRRYPELRVGQIIVNAMPDEARMFYAGDETLAAAIEKFTVTYGEGRATPPLDPSSGNA